MSPLKLTIAKGERIISLTNQDDTEIIALGGGEGLKVERIDEGGPDEAYRIFQIDIDEPEASNDLQNVIVAKRQPSGHFYIDDTKIKAKYVK